MLFITNATCPQISKLANNSNMLNTENRALMVIADLPAHPINTEEVITSTLVTCNRIDKARMFTLEAI